MKINYPPEIPFKINYMKLDINNIDFNDKKIYGRELISLTALADFNRIELDVGKDILIDSILISTAASENPFELIDFNYENKNEKLEISLKNKVIENENFSLLIIYSAKGSEPGKGFYFVEHPEYQRYPWTQGESVFSKTWFPCIDHPKLKYPRTVSVIIPKDLTVISNGILSIMEENKISDGMKKITWEERHPNPAYLTSLAIGKYLEISNNQKYKNIPLRYYVPPGREKDGERTCRRTYDMMTIYEEYFGVKYPYDKYSQVFAKDMDEYQIDGMEHSTCTTLDIDAVLATEDTPEYRIREDVIAHELSHHWFGDLVTCYLARYMAQ
jgi:aminopeptidase N